MDQKSQIDDLLAIATAPQYLSFLFDLQLSLMASNEFSEYTEAGFDKHATLMGALKDFF